MSHFSALVITTRTARPDTLSVVKEEVTSLLAPYDENGEWFKNGSKWDWWTIGGRFAVALDGYDPASDPDLIRTCNLCNGTGTRPGGREQFGEEWFKWSNGCNGCQGEGRSLAWPTQWPERDGDMQIVGQIKGKRRFFAIVTPDGRWFDSGSMGWFGCKREQTMTEEGWLEQQQAILEAHKDHLAVIVDCHV